MGSPLWPCCRMGLRNSVVCRSFPPHHPRIFPQDPLGSPPHPFCSVCCNFWAQHSASSGSEEGFEKRMEPLFSHSPAPVSKLLRAADGCSAGWKVRSWFPISCGRTAVKIQYAIMGTRYARDRQGKLPRLDSKSMARIKTKAPSQP